MGVAITAANLLRQLFCHYVDFVDVIVYEMEKVPYLFVWCVLRDSRGPTERVVYAGELLRVMPIGLMGCN